MMKIKYHYYSGTIFEDENNRFIRVEPVYSKDIAKKTRSFFYGPGARQKAEAEADMVAGESIYDINICLDHLNVIFGWGVGVDGEIIEKNKKKYIA